MGLYFPWDFCLFPGTVYSTVVLYLPLSLYCYNIFHTFIYIVGMSSLNSFALRFIPPMVATTVAVTSVAVFYILKRSLHDGNSDI